MSLTWNAKIGSKNIAIKGLKHHVETLAGELRKPVELRKYFRELTGVIGSGKESETVLWSMCSEHPLTDPDGYQVAITAYLDSLPPAMTVEQAGPWLAKAREIFKAHLPIIDRRETPGDVAQRNAEVALLEAQRNAETAEWRAQYAKGETLIPITSGQMAVKLEMCFDDSDSQSDYYAPHRTIGDDLLLAIIPKGPEREATARRVLSRYPELAKLTWTWHTENYSMGNGNYLESEFNGHHEKIKAYDGRDGVSTRWEISMTTYNKEMLPYREYPGQVDHVGEFLESKNNGQGNTPTIRRNEKFNGIEVVFPAKPDQAILDSLKGMGFRWSKFQSLWYAPHTEARLNEVNELLKAGV